MYNLNDAIYVANMLNIRFNKFTPEVTDDNIVKTAKIALAHLNEYPNYYNKEYGLPKFEEYLKQKMND